MMRVSRYIRRFFRVELVIFISGVLGLLAMLIVYVDGSFDKRWLVLSLHVLAMVLIASALISRIINKGLFRKFQSREVLLLMVLGFIMCVRLLWLKNYPLISIGDELRDGGWDAVHILEGTEKNIFAYGRYDAHGLIIPTVTSVLINGLGRSVLVYRLPTAVLGIITIYLLYFLARNIKLISGFWSALVLTTLPLSLYYSRTEIVNAFSGFWMVVILWLLFLLSKKRFKYDYAISGFILGFICNFHASIKAVAIMTMLGLVGFILQQTIRELKRKSSCTNLISSFFLLILFFIIGFGPRLLYTNTQIFFHTTRLTQERQVSVLLDLKQMGGKYFKSLEVWFNEPTNSWYPDHKPILTKFLFIFLMIGISYGVYKKDKILLVCISYLLIIPITNSVITDIVNADHRLTPLYPIGSIFVGVGIAIIILHIPKFVPRLAFQVLMFGYLGLLMINFFIKQPANLNKTTANYLFMHGVYAMQKQDRERKVDNLDLDNSMNPRQVCWHLSPENTHEFQLLHYTESLEYFLPNYRFGFLRNSSLSESEVIILPQECGEEVDLNKTTKVLVISCRKPSWLCPVEFSQDFKIRY